MKESQEAAAAALGILGGFLGALYYSFPGMTLAIIGGIVIGAVVGYLVAGGSE